MDDDRRFGVLASAGTAGQGLRRIYESSGFFL